MVHKYTRNETLVHCWIVESTGGVETTSPAGRCGCARRKGLRKRLQWSFRQGTFSEPSIAPVIRPLPGWRMFVNVGFPYLFISFYILYLLRQHTQTEGTSIACNVHVLNSPPITWQSRRCSLHFRPCPSISMFDRVWHPWQPLVVPLSESGVHFWWMIFIQSIPTEHGFCPKVCNVASPKNNPQSYHTL